MEIDPDMNPTRILFVDDYKLFESVVRLLNREPDFTIVAQWWNVLGSRAHCEDDLSILCYLTTT